MDNKEILLNLAILDLIDAIKNNNLEITKQKIQYINENYTKIQNENININDFIPFFELSAQVFNPECLNYTLDNLQGIYNIDSIKWNIQVKNLLTTRNQSAIKNFINECLINNKLKSYQCPQLIQLATIIDYQEALSQIRTILKDSLIQE